MIILGMGGLVFGALIAGFLVGVLTFAVVIILFLLIRRKSTKKGLFWFILFCCAGILTWGAASILLPYGPLEGITPESFTGEQFEYVMKRAFLIGMTPAGSALGLLSTYIKTKRVARK
ncbi:hypothetical protein NIES208_08595 [[Limnothrix rosea] IAM M-220]|nr:hypothetical protein NIES208_08595 [[Limnothrix rosea] IAM M-220]